MIDRNENVLWRVVQFAATEVPPGKNSGVRVSRFVIASEDNRLFRACLPDLDALQLSHCAEVDRKRQSIRLKFRTDDCIANIDLIFVDSNKPWRLWGWDITGFYLDEHSSSSSEVLGELERRSGRFPNRSHGVDSWLPGVRLYRDVSGEISAQFL